MGTNLTSKFYLSGAKALYIYSWTDFILSLPKAYLSHGFLMAKNKRNARYVMLF